MEICELTSRLDKSLSKKYVFKLAQTREELEACFRLLHDEYVRAGLMEPDPSGMRVTLHHALPTTSMLICRYGKRVLGTVSLIRENGLGFPMQRVFNLDEIIWEGGSVAEVSALAIDRRFHAVKDQIVMPLLKFLYEYAEYRFDTRHLVIAVRPQHIGFYEDILCFRRLSPVKHYDFVNGVLVIGAHLDLEKAKECFSQKYANAPPGKNLYHFFTVAALPNAQFPHQRFDATTDPVMTPELMNYFFNQQTKIFSSLSENEIRFLHATYDLPKYRYCLPSLPESVPREHERNHVHRRFPVKCQACLRIDQAADVSDGCEDSDSIALSVYECSEKVFCAHVDRPLAVGLSGEADVELGLGMSGFGRCTLPVEVVRLGRHSSRVVMLQIRDASGEQGELWLRFIRALSDADVPAASDLDEPSFFSSSGLGSAQSDVSG